MEIVCCARVVMVARGIVMLRSPKTGMARQSKMSVRLFAMPEVVGLVAPCEFVI
jgi:hypothetical protein